MIVLLNIKQFPQRYRTGQLNKWILCKPHCSPHLCVAGPRHVDKESHMVFLSSHTLISDHIFINYGEIFHSPCLFRTTLLFGPLWYLIRYVQAFSNLPTNVICECCLTLFSTKMDNFWFAPFHQVATLKHSRPHDRGAIQGKTSKTAVLPWFCKIKHSGGSDGTLPCYGGLSLPVRVRTQVVPLHDIVIGKQPRALDQNQNVKQPIALQRYNQIKLTLVL